MADMYDRYYEYRDSEGLENASYVSSYIFNALPADRGCRILDIGCGVGVTLAGLRDAGYTNLTGIDISSKSVASCEQRGINASVCSLTEFAAGDHERYDFIILSHVLEHLPKDEVIESLSIIGRKLLGRDGRLVVSVPNAQSSTGCYWAYEDFTHNTLFTSGSLLFVLRSAGYGEIEFLDVDGTEGLSPIIKLVKKRMLKIYSMKIDFWNWVTSSSFHNPSPRVYTYEIKALAKFNG